MSCMYIYIYICISSERAFSQRPPAAHVSRMSRNWCAIMAFRGAQVRAYGGRKKLCNS